jgi:hypothetical protein
VSGTGVWTCAGPPYSERMFPAATVAAPTRPPIVRLASTLIGESEAVRTTISRTAPGLVYVVRVRILGITAATGIGCVASARLRVAGSSRARRVGLAPRGVWCAGAGAVTVAATRRGAPTGTGHLRVRPPAAFGQGNVIGHLLLGPTCPVERIDDPCDPVAHPDPVTLVALDPSGAEAARTATLADGSFALDLPPGSYTLRAERAGSPFPSIADVNLVVSSGATRATPQRVAVIGDTGIR